MWLKIYFWFYLVLSVIGIFILLPQAPFGFADLLGILLSVEVVLAAFALAFKKKLLKPVYWKIIFWIIIFLFVEDMLELFVLPKDFIPNLLPFLKSNVPLDPTVRLLSWLLSLPGVYATYKLSTE